jgi:hypothetical protein
MTHPATFEESQEVVEGWNARCVIRLVDLPHQSRWLGAFRRTASWMVVDA